MAEREGGVESRGWTRLARLKGGKIKIIMKIVITIMMRIIIKIEITIRIINILMIMTIAGPIMIKV